MTLSNLNDVYIDQLQDVYSADKQALSATKKLAHAATSPKLKEALERGVKGIEDGMKTVSTIVREHGEDPKGEFCKGMEGIVKEMQAHALDTDFSDGDVRDAVIISQYQRMAHYGIAGYGCCSSFARRLKLIKDADRLQECLDSTYHGDKEMSFIATGEVNRKAAA